MGNATINNDGLIDGGVNGVLVPDTLTSPTNRGLIVGGTFAIQELGAGNTVVNNFGTVTGGTWTFTGATPVVFTQTGGTIMGTGTFGDLTLDGGTIAPGNSIGTITVTGDIVFRPGSTYRVEIGDAGQSDLIAATGFGLISTTGTTLAVVGEPGSYPDTSPTYTILTAAGGIDVFAANGAVFKLVHEGRFGDTTTRQSAGDRASMPF